MAALKCELAALVTNSRSGTLRPTWSACVTRWGLRTPRWSAGSAIFSDFLVFSHHRAKNTREVCKTLPRSHSARSRHEVVALSEELSPRVSARSYLADVRRPEDDPGELDGAVPADPEITLLNRRAHQGRSPADSVATGQGLKMLLRT
jgi:hypothetical protein